MPPSRMPKVTTIAASVRRALVTHGSRNASTPLLIASTPVIAVQPLANARSNSHRPTASTALGGGRRRHDRLRMSAARHGGISAKGENNHEARDEQISG